MRKSGKKMQKVRSGRRAVSAELTLYDQHGERECPEAAANRM